MKKVPLQLAVAIIITTQLTAQNTPLWLRYPAISPDGKTIVFSYKGDLYKVASNGGEAKRLTYHSATDLPYDFTPDGKYVLFGTTRNDIYTSARFPQRNLLKKLYKVPVEGGRSVMFLSAGSEFARFDSKGDKIIFQD